MSRVRAASRLRTSAISTLPPGSACVRRQIVEDRIDPPRVADFRHHVDAELDRQTEFPRLPPCRSPQRCCGTAGVVVQQVTAAGRVRGVDGSADFGSPHATLRRLPETIAGWSGACPFRNIAARNGMSIRRARVSSCVLGDGGDRGSWYRSGRRLLWSRPWWSTDSRCADIVALTIDIKMLGDPRLHRDVRIRFARMHPWFGTAC